MNKVLVENICYNVIHLIRHNIVNVKSWNVVEGDAYKYMKTWQKLSRQDERPYLWTY